MPFIGKQSTSNSQITNYTTTVGSGGQSNFTVVIEGGDETHVYLNGVLLKETTDYTVSSTQVSLVSPAAENDIVEIKVFRSFALANAVRATGGAFSGDVTVPNLIINDGGNIGSASDTDAISIPANGKPTFSAGIANTGTIDAGTLGSSVVFPAGNIKKIYSKTITSSSVGELNSSSTSIASDGDSDGVTIPSVVNGDFLLIWMIGGTLRANNSTTGSNALAKIIANGSEVFSYNYYSLLGYDAPASMMQTVAIGSSISNYVIKRGIAGTTSAGPVYWYVNAASPVETTVFHIGSGAISDVSNT